LIRLRKEKIEQPSKSNFAKYKGILSKQSLTEVEQQLYELRNGGNKILVGYEYCYIKYNDKGS